MEKIGILVYYLNGSQTVKDWNQSKINEPELQFKHNLAEVLSMTKDCYLVDIPIDRLDNLELQINFLGGNLMYLGCWNIDGSKVIFEHPNVHRNFNISLYTEKLLLPENGIPYTEQEARNIHVDFFDGWADRDLT
jgi:hypothetical protein